MTRYSDFVDRLSLPKDLLGKLFPSEPHDWAASRRIREADDATISGGLAPASPQHLALVRAALWYLVDDINAAHRIFQDEKSDLGSYWHGMMHRREADFDNARYWFRRAGRLPFFDRLHRTASEHSPVTARQLSWDPYLFTGECEQARFGDVEKIPELAKLQRAEYDVVFDYTWRQAFGAEPEEK